MVANMTGGGHDGCHDYPGHLVRADSFETFFQETAPELVVEVASPRTRRYDRNREKDVYQGFGIHAHWIIDPDRDHPEMTFASPGAARCGMPVIHGSMGVCQAREGGSA
jgi:Putative restriction endonuclease